MSRARPNILSATPLNRLGHRRRDEAWLAEALDAARLLPVWRGRNLVTAGDPLQPVLLDRAGLDGLLSDDTETFLGAWDETQCFAVGLAGDAPPAGLPGTFADVRDIGSRLDDDHAALLAYARAMVTWHEGHRWCGRCGGRTLVQEAGHVRECAACEAKHFPRVDPAIIVLVADESRCLLGRQAGWPPHRYSTIAGFVEPGESLEDAVQREVLEETGMPVTDIVYHSSQPWPFPSSLMLGFTARPAGETIDLRDKELEDARWVERNDIVCGRILMPRSLSIAYRLIEDWFDEAPGRSLAREAQVGPGIGRPER